MAVAGFLVRPRLRPSSHQFRRGQGARGGRSERGDVRGAPIIRTTVRVRTGMFSPARNLPPEDPNSAGNTIEIFAYV